MHYGIDEETVARIGGLPQGRGLLGEVIVADGPIRRDDIAADPRSCGFPPHHPPMHNFLGVPIARGGRRYGNLYLTEKMGGIAFDAEDEALVVTLAAFAAVALENALLLETERVEAVALVDLAAAEERDRVRQEMLGLVIAAQEAERARVARDLHDDVGQALTSVLLGLRLVEGALDGDPVSVADARSRIGELRDWSPTHSEVHDSSRSSCGPPCSTTSACGLPSNDSLRTSRSGAGCRLTWRQVPSKVLSGSRRTSRRWCTESCKSR